MALNIPVIGKAISKLGKLAGVVTNPVFGLAASAAGGLLARRDRKKAAQKQMDFQRELSDTAYQRAARDLEAAGLNRILALGKPASTPGGAAAPMENIATPAVNTAMAARINNQQLKNMQAQETVAHAVSNLNTYQAASASIKAQIDNMLLDVYEKNPWLREFAAISQAAGGGKIGIGAASAKAVVESIKGAMK